MPKVSYLTGHKKCGIKVGDKVKVKCKAESYELGWCYPWVRDMDSAVGRVGIVTIDNGEYGFVLKFRPTKSKVNPIGYSFPYFVLEKVK